MQVDLTKNSHKLLFAGVLPTLSVGIAWTFSQLFPNLPFWIDSLSPLAAYGLIYWLFDHYLWFIPIFRIAGITEAPDLRGRWKGHHQSSFKKNGQPVKIQVCLEIKQTFSNIVIRAHYKKSQSESVIANFKQLNGELYLFYTYDNDPNTLKEGAMQSHKGTTKLLYIPKDKILRGFYFNSIGNCGDIFLRYDGSELKFKL